MALSNEDYKALYAVEHANYNRVLGKYNECEKELRHIKFDNAINKTKVDILEKRLKCVEQELEKEKNTIKTSCIGEVNVKISRDCIGCKDNMSQNVLRATTAMRTEYAGKMSDLSHENKCLEYTMNDMMTQLSKEVSKNMDLMRQNEAMKMELRKLGVGFIPYGKLRENVMAACNQCREDMQKAFDEKEKVYNKQIASLKRSYDRMYDTVRDYESGMRGHNCYDCGYRRDNNEANQQINRLNKEIKEKDCKIIDLETKINAAKPWWRIW